MSNPAFPQLSTGSIAQYPIQKTISLHVVVNELEDGSTLTYLDTTSGTIRWDMRLSAISLAEMQALRALFNSSYGPWSGFVFLDPTDNLLSASANLLDPAWQTTAGMNIVPGVSDPFGGTKAFSITNSSQAVALLSQTLASPSTFTYSFSAYLRASTPSEVVFYSQAESQQVVMTVSVGTVWQRAVANLPLTTAADSWSIGVQLAPGQHISIFGPQVDAQPSPSPYRATTAKGGIYPDTHWVMDALAFVIAGPNEFSAQISLESYQST